MKKFLRTIVLVVSIVAMLAAIIIGVGIILSVKNINVTLYSYNYNALVGQGYSQEKALAAEADKAKEQENILYEAFGGRLMTSVSESDVKEMVEESGYKLQTVSFVYPCTLNVTIYEKTETFAVKKDSFYDIYDSDGEFMYSSEENVNSYDNAPNITISCTKSGNSIVITDETVLEIARISEAFKESFGNLRTLAESIEIVYEGIGETSISHLIFRLRSGVDIRIVNFEDDAEEKINEAYNLYSNLTDTQKLFGEVYAISEYDGEISAAYQKTKY